jgi:uncharacterized protein
MAETIVMTPVAPAERIHAMDVLRGFALLGIFLMNIEAFVSPLEEAMGGLNPHYTGVDRWVDGLIYFFVQGKFFTMFSLLFGMGFAVMAQRAEQAGRAFLPVYLRRTLALLAIGLVHAVLIWWGDVLVSYAFMAFVLMGVYLVKLPQKLLPWLAGLVYLAPCAFLLLMGLASAAAQLDPKANAELSKLMADQGALMIAVNEAQRLAYGAGSFAEATARRWADLTMMLSFAWLMFWPMILGMFLLGSWFVRSGAIADPARFPRLFSRLRWIALPLGLASMSLSFWLMPSADMGAMSMTNAVATCLANVAGALMCLGYVGWLVGRLQASPASPLTLLAPAGRMALTNYLLQSIVCTLVFYGYGLGYFEQLPRAWQAVYVVTFFALQVALSHWWLSRFRFGPMEWLWRAATYLAWPPMRR